MPKALRSGAWKEVELFAVFPAGLCKAQFFARRPWPYPVGFLPSIAVHGSPRRQLWSGFEVLCHAWVPWPWTLRWGLRAKLAPICYPMEPPSC